MTTRRFLTNLLGLAILILASCGQHQSKPPTETMSRLQAFKAQEKFVEDMSMPYPGIGDPALKPILTEKINLVADDFEALAASGKATDRDYQLAIRKGLDRFELIYSHLDTENRERICFYFEELMEIVGLRSSAGQLEDFMYH